jgi:hypothetical protein
MNDALRLAADLGGVLDRLGVPYCICGSWASTLRGRPRQTLDIDLIVEMRDQHIAPLCAALTPRYYVSAEAVREAVEARRAFNVIDPDTGMKADCFVRGDAPFDLEEFARRRMRVINEAVGLEFPVKSPEDSVLRKLQWFRDGGGTSDQQWRDVLGVLAVNAGELDERYLDRWAAELSVSDLLARARDEASR